MKHPNWCTHCKYILIFTATQTTLFFIICIALRPVSALKVVRHQAIIQEREDVYRNQSPSNMRFLSKVLFVIVDINMYLLLDKH